MSETDLASNSAKEAAALDVILSSQPTPEMAAMFAEECERLLGRLDPDLQRLALGTLHGQSNEELASDLSCGLRTIERRLELIRRIWKSADDPD